jgi:hypothetical protein
LVAFTALTFLSFRAFAVDLGPFLAADRALLSEDVRFALAVRPEAPAFTDFALVLLEVDFDCFDPALLGGILKEVGSWCLVTRLPGTVTACDQEDGRD